MAAWKQKLSAFFNREKDRMVGFVKNRVRTSPGLEAEDIVQDVMLSLFSSSGITAEIEHLGGYIYPALRNRIIDYYRKPREKALSLQSPAAPGEDVELGEVIADLKKDTHREVEDAAFEDRLFVALDGLPPEQSAVWVAVELEGRTFEELALEWDEPLGTLLARKHRAARKLKAALKDWE